MNGCHKFLARRLNPYSIFIGTASPDPTHGIYHFDFDPDTGAAGQLTIVAALPQSNFLTISPSGRNHYAAG
jgi:6-phosphogluconolactonase (cycloisomerase 2 family)